MIKIGQSLPAVTYYHWIFHIRCNVELTFIELYELCDIRCYEAHFVSVLFEHFIFKIPRSCIDEEAVILVTHIFFADSD